MPNSLLVSAANNRFMSGQTHFTPTDRGGRKIDALGRKVFSSSSMEIKVANYQAVMSHYQFPLWERMPVFVQDLPDDKSLKLF